MFAAIMTAAAVASVLAYVILGYIPRVLVAASDQLPGRRVLRGVEKCRRSAVVVLHWSVIVIVGGVLSARVGIAARAMAKTGRTRLAVVCSRPAAADRAPRVGVATPALSTVPGAKVDPARPAERAVAPARRALIMGGTGDED